jgi:hypothetical protein
MTPSTMNLSIALDMKTALRLSRFEVETGVGLDQILVSAVEEWERNHPAQTEAAAQTRTPVYFDYTPRGVRPTRTWTTRGLYDVNRNEVEITMADVDSLVGQRGTPSDMAMAVVRALKPNITSPNRNGLRDWKQSGSGRPVGELIEGWF